MGSECLALHHAGASHSGTADLPLHGGHVPEWLSQRMEQLGRVLIEALVIHYGPNEVLRRLAHPFWFQSFGAVLGMDWHSSGVTTSVCGALKRGLKPIADELGIYICGGRGRYALETPKELEILGEKLGLDGVALQRASRLVAKVDNAAIQDGFQIYHHCFIVTNKGNWTVVQQGMDDKTGMARRYHWLSEGVRDFCNEPHAAIEGFVRSGNIVNLVDHRAKKTRSDLCSLVSVGPDRALWQIRDATRQADLAQDLPLFESLPHLTMPARHQVTAADVSDKRLYATLLAAHEAATSGIFDDFLLTPGLGPRTLSILAFVAEVVHGDQCRFSDPARFSLALGGKDGHPFPVPLRVYDETIAVLKNAIRSARLGQEDKLSAIRHLDEQAREIEAVVEARPDLVPKDLVETYIKAEKRRQLREDIPKYVTNPKGYNREQHSSLISDGSPHLARSTAPRSSKALSKTASQSRIATSRAKRAKDDQLELPGF